MNCDCLEIIRKNLKDSLKVESIDFQLKMAVNLKTFEQYTTFPPLYFTYNKLKKNGTPERRETRSWVAFSHCPFCGKLIKESK